VKRFAAATLSIALLAGQAPAQNAPEARLAHIEAAIAQDRLTQAELMLGNAVPTDPREALLYADLRLAQKRHADALPVYRQVQQAVPSEGAAWRGAGMALLHLGQVKEAEASLREAVSRSAGDWRSWNALGVALDKQGRWGESATAYDRALALAPGTAAILNNRAYSLILQRRYDDALPLLEQAQAQDRSDRQVAVNLQLVRGMTGEAPKRGANETRGQWAARLNTAGYGALMAGDLKRAQSLFARALEVSETHYEAAARNLERVEAALKR
jgi:Flp pilus assembly protein TadD